MERLTLMACEVLKIGEGGREGGMGGEGEGREGG